MENNIQGNRHDLPDPFLREDGTRLASPEEWPAQREYWKKMLEGHFYGTMPPKPDLTIGRELLVKKIWARTAVYKKIRISTGRDMAVEFNVHVFHADGAKGAIPVVIGAGDWLDVSVIRMAVGQGF